MGDIKLCTEGDFALSEKLHAEHERAKQTRAEAQPRVDQAAGAYELAVLHRHAAGSLCDNVPQDRIAALDAEVVRAKAERDRVLAGAETPYRAALLAMHEHDHFFINAATSWLGMAIRDYGAFDQKLVDLCQPTRRKLDDLGGKRASLREIAATFQPVYEQVNKWKLPEVQHPPYGVHPPTHFAPPRLSDWLERK